MIRICFKVKFQRTKKVEVFSQGTHNAENLKCEILYIADYENVNISSFAVLGIKLWLEEDGDFNRNDPLYSFKFIQSKVQNLHKMLSSFSYNFISNITNFKNFCIFVIATIQSFTSQIFFSRGSLGRKPRFFLVLWDLMSKQILITKPKKSSSTS